METEMPDQAEPDDAQLKEFLSFVALKYRATDRMFPDAQTMAGDGLREAVSDCMDMLRHLTPTEVAKLDSELRLNGIPSLSELRRRYSRDYARAIKRGRIEDESEYYLLRNVLFDPGEKTADEREWLERLISGYERTLATRSAS
jgi:hypothetical protein